MVFAQKATVLILVADPENFKIEKFKSEEIDAVEPAYVSFILKKDGDQNTFKFKAAHYESKSQSYDDLMENAVRMTFEELKKMTPFKLHEVLLYYAGGIMIEHNLKNVEPKYWIAFYQGDPRVGISEGAKKINIITTGNPAFAQCLLLPLQRLLR
jgi:hypothetical protein